MNADELWRPVVGFEGLYSVSNCGRVRSETRAVMRSDGYAVHVQGQILRQFVDRDGYPRVGLRRSGKRTRAVHQLVLEAFVGPRPPQTMCCHRDGNPSNLRLDNLRWDTASGNAADAIKHGTLARGERCHLARLTADQVSAIRQDNRTQSEIARQYGVHQTTVSTIKSRQTWAHI